MTGDPMKTLVKWSLVALTSVFASIAAAQDTSETSEEFPVGAEPEIQIGQTYLVKKSGDWEVRCVKVAEGPEPCHIYQLLKDADGNAVSEISVFHLPGGGAAVAGATAITPLGTMLTAGLLFAIGDKPPKQYPFNWCESVGCIARIGLTGIELEAMKKGSQAQLQISSIRAPGKKVEVPISLKGFSDGFSAVLVNQ